MAKMKKNDESQKLLIHLMKEASDQTEADFAHQEWQSNPNFHPEYEIKEDVEDGNQSIQSK